MFNIYKNKRIFLTGHTGFKGSWLSLWLAELGAEVCGYSLEPDTNPSMFKSLDVQNKIAKSVIGDILDYEFLNKTMAEFHPDIVFHLAAQPLVRESYAKPIFTYQTNVIGTLNVLEAARQCKSVKAFVNVTTDKCYENIECDKQYKETDILGGYDMYSSSKACSEILSSSYRRTFLEDGYALATARAGNVIGGGDWAKDRLIPDCVRNSAQNKATEIRNPHSIRPWQFVLEPLSGYMLLGEKLLTHGKTFAEPFNFGPDNKCNYTVNEVAQYFIHYFGKGKIIAKNEFNSPHEAGLLMLDIEKAKQKLGWVPSYNIEHSLKETAEWYKNFYTNSTDMYKLTIEQIKAYEASIKWNKN